MANAIHNYMQLIPAATDKLDKQASSIIKLFDCVEYRLKDELHREDGPAVEWSNGSQEYWVNGKRHREDGPAIIHPDGTELYFINGKLHREDGPAIINYNGNCDWFINGFDITIIVKKWLFDTGYTTPLDTQQLFEFKLKFV